MSGRGILQKDLAMFHDLAIVSQLRGLDGAGFYQINSRATTEFGAKELLCKSGDDFNTFWYNEQLRKAAEKNKHSKSWILDDLQSTVIIGHVRAATKGFICDENSHPFKFEKIVGAHNGTIHSKYHDKNRTDSELLFEDMNERGILPVLNELTENDALAISVYDREKKTLTLGRNKHRTLYVAANEERDVIYWASEKNMLLMVAARRGIKITEVQSIEENTIITVDPEDISKSKLDIFTKQKFTPKKVYHQPAVYTSYDHREFWSEWEQQQINEERKEAAEKAKEKRAKAFEATPTSEDKKTTQLMLPNTSDAGAKIIDLKANKKKKEGKEPTLFPKRAKRNPRIAPDICDCCGKFMDLVEQYFATKHGKDKDNPDGMTCAQCTSNIKLGLPSVDQIERNHMLN